MTAIVLSLTVSSVILWASRSQANLTGQSLPQFPGYVLCVDHAARSVAV
jgi:hypothetical protein